MPTVLSDARGPFGRNVPLAAAIRRALRDAGHATPVVTSGSITTFEQAEGILERGEADCVAAARQSLADPDWFRKIRLGLGHLVRRCEFTNYCEGLDQRHKQVTCKLWDRKLDPTEPTVRLASDGKRRLLPPSWTPPSADWRHRARRLLVGSACALRIVSDQWRDCSVTLFVEGRVSMALDRSAHHAHRLSRDR